MTISQNVRDAIGDKCLKLLFDNYNSLNLTALNNIIIHFCDEICCAVNDKANDSIYSTVLNNDVLCEQFMNENSDTLAYAVTEMYSDYRDDNELHILAGNNALNDWYREYIPWDHLYDFMRNARKEALRQRKEETHDFLNSFENITNLEEQ